MFSPGGIKEMLKRDPVITMIKGWFSAPDPLVWNYKQARKYSDHYRANFDFEKAVAHYKEAIKLNPQNPLLFWSLGELLLAAPAYSVIRGVRSGFPLRRAAELAVPQLQAAIRLKPSVAWPYSLLAVAYEYQGQKEKAREAVNEALAREFPEDVKEGLRGYLKLLNSPSLDGVEVSARERACLERLRQAMVYRDAGNYKKAEKEVQAASQVSPGSKWMYDTLCQLGEETDVADGEE
jgi:tetratricopeptide (TPR) repeat protein